MVSNVHHYVYKSLYNGGLLLLNHNKFSLYKGNNPEMVKSLFLLLGKPKLFESWLIHLN